MKFKSVCWILLYGVCYAASAGAQQTIFNVPSAEVAPQKKFFLQHESQFRWWRPGRFLGNTEYVTYGIGYHTELTATLFNVNAPPSDNITLGTGFKSVLPFLSEQLATQEMKATFGSMIPVSFQGDGVGNWTYSHLSGRLPFLKTRLTAGASFGTHQIFGRNVFTFVGGYEQPITRWLTLQGDWFSGTHNLGLFIPGFSCALGDKTTLYVGYQIPNNDLSGQQGFVIELGQFL